MIGRTTTRCECPRNVANIECDRSLGALYCESEDDEEVGAPPWHEAPARRERLENREVLKERKMDELT